MSSEGSSASAQAHHAIRMEDSHVSATGCRTHPPTYAQCTTSYRIPDDRRSSTAQNRTKVQWTTLKEGSTLLSWSFEETVCFDHSFRPPVFLHSPECSAANPRMLPSPAA